LTAVGVRYGVQVEARIPRRGQRTHHGYRAITSKIILHASRVNKFPPNPEFCPLAAMPPANRAPCSTADNRPYVAKSESDRDPIATEWQTRVHDH
jgi:hypothetical protein